MNINSSLHYIFDGFKSFENPLNPKIKYLSDSSDMAFIVFNFNFNLVFVELKQNNELACQAMAREKSWKELFHCKNTKINVCYYEISFPGQIVDFDFNKDVFFVLTSGSCLCFLVKDLPERFSSFVTKSTGDVEDVFNDLLCPIKKVPQSSSKLDVNELGPVTIIRKLNGEKLSCRKSSVYILFDDIDYLSLHSFDVKLQQSKLNVCKSLEKHFFLSMSPSNDFVDNVASFLTISHLPNLDTDILVSANLFKCLCNDSGMTQGSLGVILCSNSNVLQSVMDKSVCEEPKMLYSFGQPIFSICCLSLKEVCFDNSATLPYEMAAESHIKEKITSYKKNLSGNNCLVIIGTHGKIVLITSNGDDGIQYHVDQMAFPVTAFTSTGDAVIVSNSSQILLYKVILKANPSYGFEGMKQVIQGLSFSLHCVLVNTVPIFGVQSMCVVPVPVLTVACLNSKQKILKVTFDDIEPSSIMSASKQKHGNPSYPGSSSGDFVVNISKLDDANKELKQLKRESEKLNHILHEIKMATSICYQLQQKDSNKDSQFDVLVELKQITLESRKCLLVSCSLKNDSEMCFSNGWSITVKYFKDHCNEELDSSLSRKCHIENLPFCMSPHGKFDFSFVISWSWLSYAGTILNFYLNFVPCEDFLTDSSCTSVFLKSHAINVLNLCEVVDTSKLVGQEGVCSVSDDLMKEITLNLNVWNDDKISQICFSLDLTMDQIKFMQNRCDVHDTNVKSIADVFALFVNFLTEIHKYTTNQECVMELKHLNGDKIELAIKENGPASWKVFLKSKCIGLLIAVIVVIKTKFQSCPLRNENDKADCEKNLKILKELLSRCDWLKKQISKSGISHREKNKAYSDLLRIYVTLRETMY